MISLTLAKKYARAFLEIGLQDKNHETLKQDLQRMTSLLNESKELKGALVSPAFPVHTRKGIARGIGQSLSLAKTTMDFIDLLIERDRMDHFPEILMAYENLCDEVAGRVRATLVTAMDLSPELVTSIKERLESSTGKEVVLSLEKDPSLIGGVLTRIGNVIYDGSLKIQLSKVRDNLYTE